MIVFYDRRKSSVVVWLYEYLIMIFGNFHLRNPKIL